MGEADRYIEYKNNRRPKRFLLGQDNNALVAVLAINIACFLILLTLQVGYYFYEQTAVQFNDQVMQWFALPNQFVKLSERPWTLITFMFGESSRDLFRGVSNMLWLCAFGYVLQQIGGNSKLVAVYLYGGLAGGLVFIGSAYGFTDFSPAAPQLLGANASVLAVAVATTALDPAQRFFTHIRKGIPIGVLLLLYICIDFGTTLSMGWPTVLSHLGGGLAGWLFVVLLRKDIDGSRWMNQCYQWATELFLPNPDAHRKATKERVFYNPGKRAPFLKQSHVTQQRIDELLDKINEKGYSFLTDEEKAFLKKAGEDGTL